MNWLVHWTTHGKPKLKLKMADAHVFIAYEYVNIFPHYFGIKWMNLNSILTCTGSSLITMILVLLP